eukprot:Transcript_18649.p4 GENE.Transcript_18649~~Transcript_18649.p4  ORF type:complete len:264 (-),score=67.48 Transcript_18649:551-1342(-)
MGPTFFLPPTQHEEARAALQAARDACHAGGGGCAAAAAAQPLRVSPRRRPALRRGHALLYDSRLHHGGGANRSPRRRALLQFSFRAAEGQAKSLVGSLVDELRGRHTLASLRAEAAAEDAAAAAAAESVDEVAEAEEAAEAAAGATVGARRAARGARASAARGRWSPFPEATAEDLPSVERFVADFAVPNKRPLALRGAPAPLLGREEVGELLRRCGEGRITVLRQDNSSLDFKVSACCALAPLVPPLPSLARAPGRRPRPSP